jgi:hypothetical protein
MIFRLWSFLSQFLANFNTILPPRLLQMGTGPFMGKMTKPKLENTWSNNVTPLTLPYAYDVAAAHKYTLGKLRSFCTHGRLNVTIFDLSCMSMGEFCDTDTPKVSPVRVSSHSSI